MKKIGSLRRIYLNGVTLETDGLDWVAQFPKLTEFLGQGGQARKWGEVLHIPDVHAQIIQLGHPRQGAEVGNAGVQLSGISDG